MKTIVHIGQHKTGTTSLQNYLKSNRGHFSDRGLYVPDSIMGFDNPSHFMLNVYSLNINRYSSMKEALVKQKPKEFWPKIYSDLRKDIEQHYVRAEYSGCQDVVWTNEGLYLLNSIGEYKRLYNLFKPFSSKVVCVCCFREISSFRTSYINQLQNQGISISSYSDSYRYVAEDSWLFDYVRKARLLSAVFDEVVTFPYSEVDNTSAFLKVIGYDDGQVIDLRLNVS